MKIKRALISVSDKMHIVPFARRLSEFGIEIVSTGGTAALLQKEGIPHIEIEKFTGFPEILSGRVKTLHPRV
ncbi:MAG TPA: bifunctional phosphoribosylaminoimidazolecarboxamide formyltransferase/IMP cyclohydrolase, partial [Chthoniobacterales bacterium]|nr:bifunctional phosphoribosylaminoimidazolecarboxamide formyltransferase/IMP cyclohydrolase [Chthoniobacterales bacterium]